MKKIILSIFLSFFLFLSLGLGQSSTQTQFRGVFQWRNVTAWPDTAEAHYHVEFGNFNDQGGEYLATGVDSTCVAWDNLGGRWRVVRVDSATVASAWVLVKSLNASWGVPFGVGFVSKETGGGAGLSLTAPDNSTGISPQLQARIEGHNMILIDNLFEDIVLNMVDTFYMAADTGGVQQLLATDTIKINGGYGVVTGLSGENRTVIWADTLELSTVYHSEHYADSLFLLDLDQDSTNEIQYVDSLTLSGTTLGVSLSSDGIPAVTVNLAPILSGYTTGSGAAGQVTYWSGATSITGENNLFWDAANDRLGVGTATPSFALHINGSVSSSLGMYIRNQSAGAAFNGGAMVVLENDNSSGSAQLLKLNSAWGTFRNLQGNDFGIYNSGVGNISIFNNVASADIDFLTGTSGTTPQMTLDDTGFLGLNNTAPSYPLDINYVTGIRLPVGTTAQRPTNSPGVKRYNSSLGFSETANGSAWLQSDFPAGATTNTIRHDGSSWIASSNLINDGTVVRAAGATNRIHLYPSDFTDGQTFNGQISLLNNAEAAAAKLAVGGSQLWLRVIGGLSGTGRGILMSPNGAAVLTATNTLLTLNTATASTLLDFRYNGVLAGSFSTGSDGNGHLLVRSLGTSTNRGISVYHHQTGIAGASQMFYRSRGTGTSPTTLASGDIIGANVFRPYDGSNYTVDNCFFGGSVTGAVSAGNTPSSLFFIAGPTQSYLPDLLVHSGGNVGVGSSGTGDITSAINTPPRQLTVYGEARITDLTTDTPTRIVGADADGDLSANAPGFGLAYTGGVLQVDSTVMATQSDLASAGGPTIYTADGTIADSRTVTIKTDSMLTIQMSGGLSNLTMTKRFGYIPDWGAYGWIDEASWDDYSFYNYMFDDGTGPYAGWGVSDNNDFSNAFFQINENGNITALGSNGTDNGSFNVQGGTAAGYAPYVHGDNGIEFDTGGGGKIYFQINNTTEAIVDATGVGIGDTSPESSLDVAGMTKTRQLVGQDGEPTTGTNANMGTGRSVSVTASHSSGLAGRFSFTSGTGLTAGEWFTFTFPYSFSEPPAVQIFPEDADGASLMPYIYVQPTTTGCSFGVNVTGGAWESKTFEFNYIIIGGN